MNFSSLIYLYFESTIQFFSSVLFASAVSMERFTLGNDRLDNFSLYIAYLPKNVNLMHEGKRSSST